jgi:TonB family protein
MRSLGILEQASRLSERAMENHPMNDVPGHNESANREPQVNQERRNNQNQLAERGPSSAPAITDFRLSAGLKPRPRSWTNVVTSVAIHLLVVILSLIAFVPGVQTIPKRATHFVLFSPRLQPYRAKIKKPEIPTPRLAKPLKLNPVVMAKLEPLPKPKPPMIEAPNIAAELPVQAVNIAPRIELPKQEPPKVVPTPKPLSVGGFGDLQAAPSVVPARRTPDLPRLGSFELADGPAHGPTSGRGTVASAGFGSMTSGSGNGPVQRSGSLRTGGFGDASAGRETATQRVPARVSANNTPPEILFKPKPAYSAEGRELRIEGQVALDAILEANGKIHILQVLHPLGHGLDEAAKLAAEQIRFRPATRDGVPVDTHATLYITFQLI